MSNLVQLVEQSQTRSDLPQIPVGSTVKVSYKVIEGGKTRVQPFIGVVIRKHLGDKNSKATFTVRKVVQGHGVERIFPLHSPKIDSVEILKIGKVRRAKLYYLRKLKGKAARIREKLTVSPKSKAGATA